MSHRERTASAIWSIWKAIALLAAGFICGVAVADLLIFFFGLAVGR